MIPLRTIDTPSELPNAETPTDFARALEGPSLIRVTGRDPSRVRVISTLLHGNEPSGLSALHAWLQRAATPATDVIFFIGNVDAALARPGGLRALPDARDWNRIWLPPYEGAEGRLAEQVLDLLSQRTPEAVLDLHNNTGHNPPYGVSPVVDAAHLHLCALFAERLIWSRQKLGAFVEATGAFAPSLTIESGRAGDPAADRVALEGLERFLSERELGLDRPHPRHVEVLGDSIRVQIAPGIRLDFAEGPAEDFDLVIHHGIDAHNFRLLPRGFAIGWVRRQSEWPLRAFDEDGAECSRDWFCTRGAGLVTTRPSMAIMMTTDREVAATDCLFYLVRPVDGTSVITPAREA